MLRIYEYAFLLGSIQCPDCVNRQLGALLSYQATSAHELRSFVLHHIIKVRLIEITLVLMVMAHQLGLRAGVLVAEVVVLPVGQVAGVEHLNN